MIKPTFYLPDVVLLLIAKYGERSDEWAEDFERRWELRRALFEWSVAAMSFSEQEIKWHFGKCIPVYLPPADAQALFSFKTSQVIPERPSVYWFDCGTYGPMFNETFFLEELRLIFRTLSLMESGGNVGWYSHYLPGPAKSWFEHSSRHKQIRDATVFWSKGWGWRLRKKTPMHWRDAFMQMFPDFDTTNSQPQKSWNGDEIPF